VKGKYKAFLSRQVGVPLNSTIHAMQKQCHATLVSSILNNSD